MTNINSSVQLKVGNYTERGNETEVLLLLFDLVKFSGSYLLTLPTKPTNNFEQTNKPIQINFYLDGKQNGINWRKNQGN
jgi:hypothetical protein